MMDQMTFQQVEIDELLPSGYSWVSDDGAGSYDPVSGIWTISNLLNGSSITLRIDVFVEFSLSPLSNYVNSAEVNSSTNFDPDSTPINGISSEDDQDEAGAAIVFYDLGIDKTVDNANPCVGENVQFTLVVDHAAAFSVGTAAGVEVTDVLPAGFTYVSDDSGNYTPGTGVWLLSNLAPGASQTLNIIATATTAGSYTNTATITSSAGFNFNTGNNSDSVSIAISAIPATPTITEVAATCLADGTATVSNYDASLTYTFSPAGPTVGAAGVISNMTYGTSYTVTSENATCYHSIIIKL